MQLLAVEMENIRSYVSEKVVFPAGSVMLAGDIGAGKSTILLSIEFALFGVIRGSVDGTALLRHGCSSGSVRLFFKLGGQIVEIFRPLKRGKNGIAQDKGYIALDGVRTDCTPLELKARVLEMLGYPQSLLSKSKALIYRYTVYTPQEEMNHILFEDAASRLDTLRRVFQIDRYKQVKENATIVARALRERSRALAQAIADLPQKKSEHKEREAQLQAVTAEIASFAARLEKAAALVRQQRAAVETLEQRAQEAQTLREAHASARASLEQAQRQKASLQAEQQQLGAQLEELKKSSTVSAALHEQFAKGVSSLTASLKNLDDELAGKQKVIDAITSLESQLSAYTAKISAQDAVKSDAESLMEKIGSMVHCPMCVQDVGTEHKAAIRREQEMKIKQADAEIARLQSLQHTEKKRLELLRTQREQFSQREVLRAQLQSWLDGCEHLDAGAAEPAPDIEFAMKSLAPLKKKLEAQQQSLAVLKEKENRLQSLASALDQSEKQLTLQQQEKEKLAAKLVSYEPLANELHDARTRLDALVQEEKQQAVQHASLVERRASVERELVRLAAEIEKLNQSRKELDSLTALQHWLSEYFINVVGVMEKRVMMRVYHDFNDHFRQWFDLLLGDESVSARLDDTFSPVIEQNGYETAVQNLSGGEKTSCALAYRLALNKVINDMVSTIRTKDLIILDEPTDGFSSEQLEKVRDVLAELNLAQVILVSHESKVESFVQHVIRLTKSDGQSALA